jgi:hypothetical protein
MMELEISSREVMDGEDNGFPVFVQPIKYFWLCIGCSEKYILHRWTPSGVVLLPRSTGDRQFSTIHNEPNSSKPHMRFHTSARLEAELSKSA